jgi:SOS-response transcriptional repressor LexA
MTNDNNRSVISMGPRIKQIRQAKSLTQKQFADTLGIVQGFLSGLERGKKVPSDTLLIALCHLYEINQEWLETGTGDMFKKPSLSGQDATYRGTTAIPLLRQIPSEFPQRINTEDVSDHVSLPNMPEGCFSIINYGDFMAPTIRDGDLVIFQADGDIRNRDIVLVHNRWGETILRRYRLKTNEIFLAPDNPSYAPFKPDPNTKIIGRVIDVWRKIKL